MNATPGQLAVVTGASTGIGLELARLCARQRWDLIVAADEPLIEDAARELSATGISCTAVQCDLATAIATKSRSSPSRERATAAGSSRAVPWVCLPPRSLGEPII
jgi:short-subunit dehydrogenase